MNTNEAIAIKFFGWQWMSWVGIPVRETPGYPKKQRCRQFMSSEQLDDERWQRFLKENDAKQANGDEPFEHSNSFPSGGTRAMVPDFEGDWNAMRKLELKIWKRGGWGEYQNRICLLDGLKKRCRVALELEV